MFIHKTETLPVYDSSERRFPALDELLELLHYRYLVQQTVRRNIVVRYKRSALGIAWTMLNPLGTTLIMAIVFSKVFGGTSAYAAYVLSGLIAWTFFSQTTSDAMGNLIWGGDLLKRIYIPRTVFAVSSIGTGLVNLALSFVPLLVVMLTSGLPLKLPALFLPIPTLLLAMFSLGMGLLLSSIAIHFVDVAQMYQIILTAWMYLSPVIYTEEMLPQQYVWIVHLNPMYYLIKLFRTPIYDGRLPDLNELAISTAIALVTLVAGWIIFSHKADEFAYRV
jgi:ABC-2 type transport system permease protein